MSEAKVTSKGQVTIPADIRKALRLAPGTRLVFTQLSDGSVKIRAKNRSIMELKGMLVPRRGKKVSIAEMKVD
jgi:antitoxin PrlF